LVWKFIHIFVASIFLHSVCEIKLHVLCKYHISLSISYVCRVVTLLFQMSFDFSVFPKCNKNYKLY
jgi:hypothetical protein